MRIAHATLALALAGALLVAAPVQARRRSAWRAGRYGTYFRTGGGQAYFNAQRGRSGNAYFRTPRSEDGRWGLRGGRYLDARTSVGQTRFFNTTQRGGRTTLDAADLRRAGYYSRAEVGDYFGRDDESLTFKASDASSRAYFHRRTLRDERRRWRRGGWK